MRKLYTKENLQINIFFCVFALFEILECWWANEVILWSCKDRRIFDSLDKRDILAKFSV